MILVFLGGSIGAMTRFGISEIISSNKLATWIVNILGSLMLVSIYIAYNEAAINSTYFTFWGVGFSGAFTTFSTINNQFFETLINKKYLTAIFLSSFTYFIILLFIFLFYFLISIIFLFYFLFFLILLGSLLFFYSFFFFIFLFR